MLHIFELQIYCESLKINNKDYIKLAEDVA